MKTELKKIKKLLILAAILLIVACSLIIFNKKITKKANQEMPINNAQIANNEIADKENKFSRVSFFLSFARSSIAIPESWEGKYRLKEEGNSVKFIYIANPNILSEIFTIYYHPPKSKIMLKSDEKIIEKYNNFSYIKEKNDFYNGNQKAEFDKMQGRVDELITGFSSIK